METIRRSLIQVGEALGIRNLDPEGGLIFITGGTGVVGHRIAVKLLRAGYAQVRVAAHSSDNVAELNKLGAEVADFSWNLEDSYEKALKGVKTVICTIPYTMNWDKHFDAFLHACIRAGVKHFIKLSFYHARHSTEKVMEDVPLIKAHGRCDSKLVNTLTPTVVQIMGGDVDVGVDYAPQMSYTILYASFYMSNPLTQYYSELHPRDGDKPVATFFGASANSPVNYVSPNDVTEVAVRVALEPRTHFNKEYTLTGSEMVTDQQVADLLGKHLQRPVMYVDQTLQEFERELCAGGEPSWHVLDLVGLEKIKNLQNDKDGNPLITETNDIFNLCGHKPETFEEYLLARDLMIPLELGAQSELVPLKEPVE